jgi:repressor LexA
VQESLTPPQKKLLIYILDSIRDGGCPPTVREICHEFGYRSTGTARDHLGALETKGYLKKLPGKSRGLLPRNWPKIIRAEFPSMPILGRIAAGGPLLAEETSKAPSTSAKNSRVKKYSPSKSTAIP